MTDDIRAELAELRETVAAGFARMDRYFELQQLQYLELRGEVRELRALLVGLTERVDGLEARLEGLEQAVQRIEGEVRALRDWATREFAEIRGELRQLRRESTGRYASLRSEVDALTARVDRLEERLEG
jgi:chromosome segregation ATPase